MRKLYLFYVSKVLLVLIYNKMILTVMLCMISLYTYGQVKNRVGQSIKSRVSQKTQTIPTTAAYQMRFNSVLITEKYIYYIENTPNNAVIGIDRATGAKMTIIPGIAGIYEGARERFTSIKGNDQLLYLKTSSMLWAYIPGQEKPWANLGEYVEVESISPNCMYVLFRKRDESYALYSFAAEKEILKFNSSFLMPSQVFIASNGSIWHEGGNNLGHIGVKRIDTKGQIKFYDMWDYDYIVWARKNGGANFTQLKQKGDSLYIACGRRIYQVDMLSDGVIEEYAKVPPTENNSFYRFGIDSKGNILSKGDYSTWYQAGRFDTPINLGKNVPTGLRTFDFTEIWLDLCGIRTDVDDNFIICDYNGGKLYVYNPNGVKGFTQTRGKVTR